MILVYHLDQPEGVTLRVRLYSMEITRGSPMSGMRYPHGPRKLLDRGAAGVDLRPLDRKLLMTLVMHMNAEGVATFSGREVSRLLELLSETGRAYFAWKETQPLRMAKEKLPVSLGWRVEGAALKTCLELPEGHRLIAGKPPFAFREADAHCFEVDTGVEETVTWRWLATPVLTVEAVSDFFQSLSTRYPHIALPPPPSQKVTVLESFTPTPVLTAGVRHMPGGLGLWVELRFRYGSQTVARDEGSARIRFFVGDALQEAPRATELETSRMAELADIGFVPLRDPGETLFESAENQRRLTPDAGLNMSGVIGEVFPALEKAGWEVHFAGGARPYVPTDADWYAEIRKGKRGWFSFEQGVRVHGQSINLLPALHAFLQARKEMGLEELRETLQQEDVWVEGPECLVMIPGSRFLRMVEQLFDLYGGEALDKDQRLRVTLWRAAELADAEATPWRPPEELLQTVRCLRGGLTVAALQPPASFQGELRPYQADGVGWLNFLHENRLGGILADDMGLGKTVQVLALLAHRRELFPGDSPALIVCPASVLPNWRREAARFTPHLKVHTQHGSDRPNDPEALKGIDILLTTYALLWRDENLYARLPLSTAIFDEAQAVKNPRARTHVAAATVTADVKLALTGTPCENHLGDLWALFNLVMPGFLGGEKDFRKGVRVPIEQEKCPVLRRALLKRIRPLMLRRTKERVAKDLPPKTEIITTVPLSDAQVDLYETVRAAMDDKVREEMAAHGAARSKLVVLDAMLKLRQICCDPRLRDPEGHYKIPEDSAKLSHLLDMLASLVEEGRRILLFSQFTSMLDLIQPELRKRKLPWVEIRGDTRDRETPVDRFQAGKVPLFLISLKAGGSGLNLTAADTVIHYDPWWNPAVEAQASDRAHRIGQKNPVFVYKLVAEGSIEAVILRMQAEKRSLAGLLEGDGMPTLTFDEADAKRLLAPLRIS